MHVFRNTLKWISSITNVSILFYSINPLQCQHWMSTATCAAALELPNYVHGELT